MSASAVLALGLGNLIPLLGVLLFGWSLPQILLVYWMESGVVGVIGALKVRAAIDLGAAASGRTAEGTADDSPAAAHTIVAPVRRRVRPPRGSGGWVVAALWLVVYLGFWAILGAIVIQIVNGGFYEGASTTGFTGVPIGSVLVGAFGLVIGHAYAYYRDYVRGERYLTDSLLDLERTPFARPVVLLGAIAVGGVGTAIVGAPVGFLIAMVLAKTAIELWWARSAAVPPPPPLTGRTAPTVDRPR